MKSIQSVINAAAWELRWHIAKLRRVNVMAVSWRYCLHRAEMELEV